MTAPRDKLGRPVVVVTGMGITTSLGAGKADNWSKLVAGESGIRTITRFPIDGLKPTMAGTVDFVSVDPYSSTGLSERMAELVTQEALEQAGICATGATSIQLGVEVIRRGETDAALCGATDGSVNPEALVRFSLLSALWTQNDPPQAASKPFSKNRDGFVMAEGAGALVLESYEAATARGAKILGVIAGCGELTDSFHRTRSPPDGKPIIGCMNKTLADAGMTPDQIDHINAHGTATPENDKIEYI